MCVMSFVFVVLGSAAPVASPVKDADPLQKLSGGTQPAQEAKPVSITDTPSMIRYDRIRYIVR